MKKPRILIIDDDANLRKTLSDILSAKGYEPLAAKDGTEGLALLKQNPVNVVLIDLRLPDISGLEVLNRVKFEYPSTEAIILTGHATLESAIEATNKGAFSYLQKPYEIDQLLLHSKRAIEKQQAEEALRASEEYARSIIDSSLDMIIAVDRERRIIEFNKAAQETFGYSREEILGKHVDILYADPEEGRVIHEMTVESGGCVKEIINRRKNGEVFPSFLSASALCDAHGELAGVMGISRDITERKRAEEQIQHQIQRLAALHMIDTTISASLDIRVTLNVILNQVTNQLSIDAADILLLNPHTQILEYAAGRGFRTAALQHTRLRLGESYAGCVALERKILSIPNLAEAENGFRRSPLLPGEEFIAYYGVPLIAKGQVKGVLEVFHRSLLDTDQEWIEFLEAIAAQAAIAIDNVTLFNELQRSNIELTLAYDTTLEGWSRALDLRDRETEGHTKRVTEMTVQLAHAMGMNEAELVHVRRGALLHDIGKMGISDTILLKPGPLTDKEWEIIRKHPVYAYELLSSIAFLRPALDIPYCHHERWNGTGYPRGLKGEQIPLAARIFAVVDVWDALHSDRPYRPAWPEEKIREYIREQAGKHFDPEVVKVFLEMETNEQ